MNKKDALENHKTYLERKKVYKKFGYNVDKERGFILKKAMPLKGRILEAGTGKGHFALAMAKKGYSFTTFDISKEEQRFAKLNLDYYGLSKLVKFKIENAERTSFKKGSFDTVISVNTLHHLKNPKKVIREFIRVLSITGKLVIADFTNDGFRVMDKIHSLEGNSHTTGILKMNDMVSLLKKHGFLIKQYRSKYQQVVVAARNI